MHKCKTWSASEIATMRESYGNTSAKVLSKILNRPITSILKKAQHLELCKNGNSPWTPLRNAEFHSLFSTMSYPEIAQRFGISEIAARQRAFKLGLTKDGNRRATGRKPLPIGTERVNRGVRERRVSITGRKAVDWKRVEVIEWEEKNGPVPSGYVLVHQEGRLRSAESLSLKRLGEVPMLNFVANAPGEVRELVNLKAQFGKQMKILEKIKESTGDLPCRRTRQWTANEVDFLKTNLSILSTEDIAKALKRTNRGIQKKVRKLGLNKPRIPSCATKLNQ